ncbi:MULTISPECIES: RsfA family transcriptional regulator [Bacillus cereus group]|uniref:Transcription factor RsfA n=2 Tax=Bacillus cytotoxicus TaxID=580165 RepID=A0AAX2CL48_9BACI|nr:MULTISPECIES: RsfA family transcriptional regulator [Bacillus cereus group]ABS23340.1 Transcription factor RsfA [Bacillus cytotoxicus NVH 391-98]AWC29943.1 RsfA family transcriptional regulator [Bacillus cytotoxicus]AWC42079.1 RsfA family transcriptional regulator [Bacillus cytotoxicus]AWC45967.1 RsfA family transcriptional regulator [Bacillus cytotoxicus]AWC50010.1 RsfA family transcriptional regulator [Bacillus cytotoxicus]
MKTRQDAWTKEDDFLLAETVLRHIRSGSTQLKAFDEVGDQLNRTSAACGFRWNAEVRQNYEEAIQLAKKQRKELKRSEARIEKEKYLKTKEEKQLIINAKSSEDIPSNLKSLTMQDVISFLQNIEQHQPSLTKLQNENKILQTKLTSLQKINDELETKLVALTKQQQTIEKDYAMLVRIMDRARHLVSKDQQTEQIAPIFKTDQNGDLDIICSAEN